MSYSGLTDPMRVLIMFVWFSALGIIEAKDPNRSYTWTIGTVTFGICTYLGRMGKAWTPWKRWFSIILGTLITAVFQLLLPKLGVYPGKNVSDELCEATKAIWSKSVAMVEDSIENAQDSEAGARLTDMQTTIMGSFRTYPAKWKEYSWSRTWLNLVPKPLPMDVAHKLLKAPLLKMFISSASAAQELHRTAAHPPEEQYAKLRIELHNLGLAVPKAMSVICTDRPSPDANSVASEELSKAVNSAESAMKLISQVNVAHRNHLSLLVSDMMLVVKDLLEAVDSKDEKLIMLLRQCDKVTSNGHKLSMKTNVYGRRMSEAETTGGETSVSEDDTSGSEPNDTYKGA